MLAVIDQRLPLSCQQTLKAYGHTLLCLPPFSCLASPIASHPDMLLFRLGDKLFCHKAYYAMVKKKIQTILRTANLSLCLTQDMVTNQYPSDVALNLVFTRNILIGKKEAMANEVKAYAEISHIPILSVKQGYTKCSCVVLEDALITADTGIATVAKTIGADCLLIANGDVELPGYPYGFIGGACGVCDKTVFFCGNIKQHKDGNAIEAFCNKHGYEVVSLSNEKLIDVGSLMFF